MNCPKCSDSEMKPDKHEGVEIELCSKCSGMFFDKGKLEQVLALKSKGEYPEFSCLSEKQDMLTGRCFRCDVEMEPYLGPSNMRLDRCPKCEGVFLDQGELQALSAEL